MKNNAPVDITKAVAAGGGGEDDAGGGDDASSTAKELLMRLPGVNVHNFRNVSYSHGRSQYSFFFFSVPIFIILEMSKGDFCLRCFAAPKPCFNPFFDYSDIFLSTLPFLEP